MTRVKFSELKPLFTKMTAIMNQEKIRKIDTQLIELIGQRISILAESKHPFYEEEHVNLTPLLTQVGVPKFLWENIIAGCNDALSANYKSPANIQPRRVTVIGGCGMMGRFFTSRLSVAGHKVNILESDDWDHADIILAETELVLVCVPIEYTVDVIQKTAKYLSPTAALADITSIKAPIVEAMLNYHPGPVLGLHPMFGPGIKSFLSQNVVVCSGRKDEAFQWLLDLIESDGGKLIRCSSEYHDQMMVTIQAIRHFCTFSLGVFLAEEGIDISRSLEFSSPPYRLEICMVHRLFTPSKPLSLEIMLATEDRRQAIVRLANTYTRLAQLVMQKAHQALMYEFEEARNLFIDEFANNFEGMF